MFRVYKIIWILILLLIVSCKDKNTQLNHFFKELQNNIESEKFLNYVKTLPEDSLHLISGILYGEVKMVITDSKSIEEIDKIIIDSLVEKLNIEEKVEVLVIAFQKYLNDEKYDLDQIKDNVVELQKMREIEQKKEEKIKIKKLIEIIKTNNSNWNIGDTLDLDFELSSDGNYKTIMVHSHLL